MELLNLKNVSFAYDKNSRVLSDINFSIENGEKVGLAGANGAGKSTLMKAVLGLIPFLGQITIDDTKVCKENSGIIRKKIGYVLQNSDNQMFMPDVLSDIIFAPLNYGMSREEAEKKADEVLKLLGISELKYKQNHKISGGEKRMAAIATVLAMEPQIILMDEPTASLDPYNRRTVINTINSLDTAMLIASHDLDMMLETCSRVILLSEGKVIKSGKTEEILSDKELLENHRLEMPYKFFITQ